MILELLRLTTVAALLPFASDTPPSVRLAPPPARELRAVDDVVLTARLPDGTRVPTTIVLPRLKNRRDVITFIRSNYPDTSQGPAPGIMPLAWVYIDESGRTHWPQLAVPSGSAAFDSLAVAAVRRAWFAPAHVSGKIVPVWVMLPVQLSPGALLPGELPNLRPDGPYFTPYTKKPELTNRADVQRALVRFYPEDLRARGVGGTALLWVYLDRTGKVARVQVQASSGEVKLDAAAMRVAKVMVFTPAENQGKPVPVWINLPIVFRAR
jgi:TonB family protein